VLADGWYFRTPAVAGMTAAAVLVFAAVLYDGYQRWRSLRTEATAAGPAVAPGPASTAPSFRIEDVVAAHLFGRVDVKPVASTANAPETRLNMTLHGVIASEQEGSTARAIIEVAGKDSKSYRIGDRVEGTDATVHGIEAKRVLLERNGVIESLPMEREMVDDKQPPRPGVPVILDSELPQPSPPVPVEVPAPAANPEAPEAGAEPNPGTQPATAE